MNYLIFFRGSGSPVAETCVDLKHEGKKPQKSYRLTPDSISLTRMSIQFLIKLDKIEWKSRVALSR